MYKVITQFTFIKTFAPQTHNIQHYRYAGIYIIGNLLSSHTELCSERCGFWQLQEAL